MAADGGHKLVVRNTFLELFDDTPALGPIETHQRPRAQTADCNLLQKARYPVDAGGATNIGSGMSMGLGEGIGGLMSAVSEEGMPSSIGYGGSSLMHGGQPPFLVPEEIGHQPWDEAPWPGAYTLPPHMMAGAWEHYQAAAAAAAAAAAGVGVSGAKATSPFGFPPSPWSYPGYPGVSPAPGVPSHLTPSAALAAAAGAAGVPAGNPWDRKERQQQPRLPPPPPSPTHAQGCRGVRGDPEKVPLRVNVSSNLFESGDPAEKSPMLPTGHATAIGTKSNGDGARGAAGTTWERSSESQKSPAHKSPVKGDDPTNSTVMLRNIPNRYTQAMLLNLLDEQGFAQAYDFVYLPMDFRNGVNLGYAFVNLVTHKDAGGLMDTFHGFSKWFFDSAKVCEVSWAHPHQGLSKHVDRYRNSPVMHPCMPDEYKPMMFKNGVQIPFPLPTKAIRAPKLRPVRERGQGGVEGQ
eukprot:TRINITY_DN21838_c0_g1_i1.p1 TRINITY_DN21838_c0_g1~~TRINITY_DN21838_c0_g1_i1.p1  ORF type:complete len:463 (-),score=82.54 TRINITY_DN21838_c0_g1_i1:237-1625(-)